MEHNLFPEEEENNLNTTSASSYTELLGAWEQRLVLQIVLFLPVLSPASYFSDFAKKQFPFKKDKAF